MPIQTPLTLGQMYDQIRRDIQQVPQYDISGNVADIGLPSTSFPWPNNNLLNQCVNESIDALNSIVRCGKIGIVTLTVAAATMPGPAVVDYSSSLPDLYSVSESLAVYWQPSSPATAQAVRLPAWNFFGEVRRYQPFDPMTPDNNPQQYSQTGTQILLNPPPNQAGTLYILQQEGLDHLENLSDTLNPYFPTNYHRCIWNYSVYRLACAATSNVEMQQRGADFQVMANAIFTEVYDWKNGQGQASIEAQRDTVEMIPTMSKPRPIAAMMQGNQVNTNARGQ